MKYACDERKNLLKKQARVRKSRWKLRQAELAIWKNISESLTNQAYKTKAALYKAAKKVKRVMPICPAKQQAVVAELAEQVGLQIMPQTNKFQHHCTLASVIKMKVINFYKRDDISRELPGKEQVKSVKSKETGIKTLCPKRVLNFTLRETHKLFKEEFPG